jgi:hypothetical protein
VKSGNNQATVKTSTPVSQFETKDSFPVQSHGTEVDAGWLVMVTMLVLK